MRHDTALGDATRAATRDTTHAHGLGAGCVTIQPATWPARPATQSVLGLRHGTVRAAWAQCALPGHSALRLGSGCAPGAPNPVLDSVHCFSHCLESLDNCS